MKVVFQTEDGKVFETEKKAEYHEELLKQIKVLSESILPKKFDTCEFANGDGHIQLTVAQVKKFDEEFKKLLSKHDPDCLKYDDGMMGRMLNDSDSSLYHLWCLAQKINRGSNRLYGQPYYANHPLEAKQVCLNRGSK